MILTFTFDLLATCLTTRSVGRSISLICFKSYNSFIDTFKSLYDKTFPIVEFKVKTKTLLNPWFTRGFDKSSRVKQKLYDRYLKSRSDMDRTAYLTYKNLFEKLKTRLNRNITNLYCKNIKETQKNTWKILKELLGKKK